MSIELVPVLASEAERITVMMPDYLQEMAEYTEAPRDSDGHLTYPYLAHYWREPDRFPFTMSNEGVDCGFALVRRLIDPDSGEDYHSLAEFYIAQDFRRQKLGSQAASTVLQTFAGSWEVSVLKTNLPARNFWQRTLIEICPDLTCQDVGKSFRYDLVV
ncbi:MAG: putative acetyltransferase [Candidatus Azotimanducaceae bacterium]|jgi:predicted acetyltransferase